jgi:hypothetical protein
VTGDVHLLPQDVEFNVTTTNTAVLDHVWDFVYIDDAVDATMSAMQFRPVDDDDVNG